MAQGTGHRSKAQKNESKRTHAHTNHQQLEIEQQNEIQMRALN